MVLWRDYNIHISIIFPERMSPIEILTLKKLMRKALIFNLMNNLNKIIRKAGMSHRELSERSGQSSNWFNDAYNNSEDITISSLAKVFGVLNEKVNISSYQLTDLFDKQIIQISSTLSSLVDENEQSIQTFILSQPSLFSDLLADWAALNEKNKLTSDEKLLYVDIQALLSN
ncbi:helix-turn-helix domain-containing protein [Priestia koreensis]|uniref:Uncharacterized protein n=1 Tax=Priestia koreensis TaxID=284581 RepID=A0A0M0KUV1_9BACI|nr:transcriptional regulator [Priestia koreensis]KOO42600.1 hypothetical protein AMD01_18235 [Priestia koreensis]